MDVTFILGIQAIVEATDFNLHTTEGRPGPIVPEEDARDKLSLALEPESAAIFCQNMRKQQLAPFVVESLDTPFTANCYAVIDIGGGTVDITVCQVSKIADQQIESLHHPAGNDCGGSRVNKEFEQFLGNLVDDEDFSKFINTDDEVANATNKAFLSELINEEFEKQKRLFGKKKDKTGKIAIQLPFSFMHVYGAKLQTSIQQLNDPRVQLSQTTLRLAYVKVEEFFCPIVDGLVKCISETLERVDAKIDTVYLVGGFGGSRYVYNAIKERFGAAYKYIVPMEPDFAIVRGAVLFHQKPDTVHVRRADATYGVRANIPFIEGVHDKDYKCVEDGETQCANIFSTFVEKDELLTAHEVVLMQYAPSSARQRRMHFDIYSSPETDVWYTTGRRGLNSSISAPVEVHKVGDLDIPVSVGDKNIEVTFDFSHTEIQVKAFDPSTKTDMTAVLDFLSS